MNIFDLTPNQLKRAASIKEQIDRLNGELDKLLGGASNERDGKKTGRLSPASRARIAAAQRRRWAKARKARPAKSAVKTTKMSAAARAKISARMKSYWRKKKRTGKTARPAK
jgi:hypothetical protein